MNIGSVERVETDDASLQQEKIGKFLREISDLIRDGSINQSELPRGFHFFSTELEDGTRVVRLDGCQLSLGFLMIPDYGNFRSFKLEEARLSSENNDGGLKTVRKGLYFNFNSSSEYTTGRFEIIDSAKKRGLKEKLADFIFPANANLQEQKTASSERLADLEIWQRSLQTIITTLSSREALRVKLLGLIN